jgi:hypothetical protein
MPRSRQYDSTSSQAARKIAASPCHCQNSMSNERSMSSRRPKRIIAKSDRSEDAGARLAFEPSACFRVADGSGDLFLIDDISSSSLV